MTVGTRYVSRNRGVIAAVAAVAALALTAVGFFVGRWTDDESTAVPTVLSGWATTSADYRAVAVYPTSEMAGAGRSFDVSAAQWTDGTNSWYSGGTAPSCFSPDSVVEPVPVELAYVTALASDRPGGEVVVWFRCL